jgi:glycosyltransferase involved in cell wall biosynthesis
MKDVAICMPYFERAVALERTIRSFKECGYFDESYPCSVTVSVCDDGSIDQPAPESDMYSLTRLPNKKEWLAPTKPMNTSVTASDSRLILLQSPETYHPMPVVHLMVELIEAPRDVVQVGCKNETHGPGVWFNHPKSNPNKFWFCQMLSRYMWNDVGGFSDEYRQFAHGEDGDFALRLTKAGARWRWVQDVYVVHGWKGHFRHRGPKPDKKLEEDHGSITYERYLT